MADDPRSSGEEEERAAELSAALREATERHAALFDRGLAGAFRSTLDGRLLEVNPALAAMLGCGRADDLLPVAAEELYADPAAWRNFLDRSGESGESSPGWTRARARRWSSERCWR
jgi:PAS domain-containing protein